MEKTSSLELVDYLVLAGYFCAIILAGALASWRSRGSDISGYFLASRSMHWIPIGASLFASNIGSGHFIGLAGSGAASGIGIAAFELNAVFVLMLLGWLFVPVYLSSGVYTMPEYLRQRFGGQRIRVYLSVLALLLYVFTKISADLFAGALFIQEAVGKTSTEWLYISVLILLAISAVFTIAGGLTAVIWTDFCQTVLMIVGAFILMGISFSKVGGYETLTEDYFYATASNVSAEYEHCKYPPDYAMHFFRSAKPGASDLPWTGMLFGVTVSAVWYWCTDQVIVQRTLASRSMVSAKASCVMAAALKFLPLWMLVFPGMAARVLFPDEVACVEPEKCMVACGKETGCTDLAYIKLVLELLPDGLRGLMLAVMMAALMSSLTSIFNSASTIFTVDIWIRIRKDAFAKKSPREVEFEQLLVGRAFVLVLVVISVLWIPVIQSSSSGQLFVYIQSVSSFLSPPICAVYVAALFWRRTTEPGAFWGLMLGLLVGMIRLILEFSYTVPPCGSEAQDTRPDIIIKLVGNVHYLHFGILLFLLSGLITVVVSLVTPPVPAHSLHRMTYATRYSLEPRVPIRKPKLTESPPAPSDSTSVDSHAENKYMNFLYLICGLSKEMKKEEDRVAAETPAVTKTEAETIKEAVDFLYEEEMGKKLVNIAAVSVMTVAAGFWGFYA